MRVSVALINFFKLTFRMSRLHSCLIKSHLFLIVLREHLHDEVWIGHPRKLLIAHVHIRIDLVVVLELLARKKAVVLALILDLELFLVLFLLILCRLFDLILQCLVLLLPLELVGSLFLLSNFGAALAACLAS